MVTSPSRTMGWSSATRIRMGTGAVAALGPLSSCAMLLSFVMLRRVGSSDLSAYQLLRCSAHAAYRQVAEPVRLILPAHSAHRQSRIRRSHAHYPRRLV